ncbi:MAG: RnfABCDGE type electron transport complex subunit D [Spirochaetaceae bacterium]|nr:RnfABCDGE type electron transport complex subunit D [Spirochaetaceae bacterium]
MFQKQKMMRKVIYSLFPIFLFSIYLYGWRSAAIAAVVFPAGILTEYLFMKLRKKKVSEAVLVSCALYTLSMPPTVPLWMAVIGIVFGILFGKCIYGGFGRNVFNPAITGRLFIYITFPVTMTSGWMTPGRFGTLSTDAVSGPTPLDVMRLGDLPPLNSLLTGIRMGSLGESAIVLIVIGAIYLIATKTASWRSMAATLISFIILQSALFYSGIITAPPLESLLSGSVLFIAVFMVTDPISSPKKSPALLLYGVIIGVSLALIRDFSLFPEGSSFAILMGNSFAPLLDEMVNKLGKGKKVKA